MPRPPRDPGAVLASLACSSSQVQPGRKTIARRFIADEDLVVVEGKGQMTTKAGIPYNNDYCLVYRFKDGKIAEMWEYCDSALTEKVLGPFPAARDAS